MVDTVSFDTCYKKKNKKENVTVTVEFPKQPEEKAQREFYGRLKELVLESMEFMDSKPEFSAAKPEPEAKTGQGAKEDT